MMVADCSRKPPATYLPSVNNTNKTNEADNMNKRWQLVQLHVEVVVKHTHKTESMFIPPALTDLLIKRLFHNYH